MIPFSIGSHHLLSLIDLALALGAAVLTVLVRLDDPGLHGGPGQHVILVVVELGQVLGPGSQVLCSRFRPGLGSKVGGIAGLAVNFPIRALTTCDTVQLTSTFYAGETVLVIGAHLGGTFLCLEDLASTAGTSVLVPTLPHDSLTVHP